MTVSETDMADLVRRLEEASGPLDPETACRIDSLGLGVFSDFEGPHRGDDGGDEYGCKVDGRQRYIPERELPDRSIDAALTLVERVLPGWKWRGYTERNASFDTPAHAEIMDRDWPDPLAGYGRWFDGHAATVPLAICLALLRAMQARP